MNPKIKAARERLAAALQRMNEAADAYEGAPDDASQETLDELSATFDTAAADVEREKAEIGRLERIARAREENPSPEPEGDPITVVSEPITYARENPHNSYLLDLARSEMGRGNPAEARARLVRHRDEMDVELKARSERRTATFSREVDKLVTELERNDPRAAQALQRALSRGEGLVQKRAINRTDGTGGEFVPPLWLLDEYAELARAGRPFADALRNIPLPAGTDSINVPRITTGSLTGVQTSDNAAVTSQDMATATVTAPVRTIAGQEDVAMQLLDQSPIAFDEIVFADLLADYAMQLDTQCVNGSGSAGQLLGILNVSGVNAVTYTDGTPTVPELYPKLADALNQASNNRKRVPSHYWWHGRRWFWAAAALDANTRPFFVSNSGGPTNALAAYEDAINEGGPVTNVLGVNVHLDLNIPTNLGGSSNEDRIIATRMADHILFEGDVNVRVMKEILSGTLGVRFQAYAYCAFTAGRFPAGTSVVAGTGLVTPTF